MSPPLVFDWLVDKGGGLSEDKAELHPSISFFCVDKKKPVRISGHSLGGAVASLLALKLKKDGVPPFPSMNTTIESIEENYATQLLLYLMQYT